MFVITTIGSKVTHAMYEKSHATDLENLWTQS